MRGIRWRLLRGDRAGSGVTVDLARGVLCKCFMGV